MTGSGSSSLDTSWVTDLIWRGREAATPRPCAYQQARLTQRNERAGRGPSLPTLEPTKADYRRWDMLRVFISHICEMASLPLDFLCPQERL
jgi:hypothetical protein